MLAPAYKQGLQPSSEAAREVSCVLCLCSRYQQAVRSAPVLTKVLCSCQIVAPVKAGCLPQNVARLQGFSGSRV